MLNEILRDRQSDIFSWRTDTIRTLVFMYDKYSTYRQALCVFHASGTSDCHYNYHNSSIHRQRLSREDFSPETPLWHPHQGDNHL